MNSVWKLNDVGAPKDGTKVLFLARPEVGGFENPRACHRILDREQMARLSDRRNSWPC